MSAENLPLSDSDTTLNYLTETGSHQSHQPPYFFLPIVFAGRCAPRLPAADRLLLPTVFGLPRRETVPRGGDSAGGVAPSARVGAWVRGASGVPSIRCVIAVSAFLTAASSFS